MKRIFWVGVGFGLGVAASRRRGARPRGHGRAGGWARRHVRDALAAGRTEAKQREATLRSVFAAPSHWTEKRTSDRTRNLDK
ncbi:MAG: hypothetical protein FJW86_09840 [Actinobacteria bacterium]|nr:hypothetical protein [Actinomycetota bacterium]